MDDPTVDGSSSRSDQHPRRRLQPSAFKKTKKTLLPTTATETTAHSKGTSLKKKLHKMRIAWSSSFSLSLLWNQVTIGFRSLQNSPSELWKAYILKFLDSYAYFSFSIVFTLFLSNDFGYSDVQAGSIYGAWGAFITVYGLVVGCIIDNLGVARSLQVGFLLSLLSRIIIFCATSRTTLLWNVCGLLPMGNCLGIPVLTTGIRRYTTEGNRGFAFGLFYVVMNVAALLSGPLVDACTIWYFPKSENDTTPYDPTAPWKLTGYRLVVLTGIVANVLAVFVTWTVREIKLESTPAVLPQESFANENEALQATTQHTNTISAFTPIQASAWTILKETMRTKRFWRFLAVCLIMLNVRMIFRHLDATLPKYMIREFGENVPKGTIYAINPALIILLVPLVTAATSNVDPLLMMHHGSYISAISVFILVLSTSIWSSAVFVTILSIGEAIWSPRLYDYTMAISPEGREGTYMALSSAPLFLAKLPVGFLSGYLLERYCPKDGERHSKTMWLIIGAITATSPITMTAFWKYLSYKDDDNDSGNYMELSQKKASEQQTQLQEQSTTTVHQRR